MLNKAKKMGDMNKMNLRHMMLIATLVCLLIPSYISAQESMGLAVQPEMITIGTSYTGMNLTVSGKIPEDCEAVAVLSGERVELHLKEKGKALGLLWMNMGSLNYTGVPSVFFISSQKRVEDMADGDEGDDLSVNRIGFDGLKKSITVESEKPDTQRYVDELFKLKSQDGLYQEQTGNVTYESPSQGFKTFHITIAMPSRLAPGQYSVHAYAVKDGKITIDAEKPIEAKLVGIPAFLANMAFNHSLMYGVLATLIAVIGGLIIGFVFQGAKEGSH